MRGRGWLRVSVILLLVYTGYVVWAKASSVAGTLPFRLSETQEFLLFLAAAVAFSFQVFIEDVQRPERSDGSGNDA